MAHGQERDTCFVCSDEILEDMYFICQSCEPGTSSGGDGGDTTRRRLLCQMCINYHSKQQHAIVDSAGCTPSICQKHKNVHHFYCDYCKIMFCYQCFDNACDHKLTLLNKKRSEVRGSMFDYLNNLDNLDKRVRRQQRVWKDVREAKNKSDAEFGAKAVYQLMFHGTKEYVVKKLENVLSDSSVDENLTDEIMEQVIAEADKMNLDLRAALQCSVGNQIKEMATLKPKLESSLENQRSQLSRHVSLKKFSSGVALDFEDFKQSLDKVIDSVKPACIQVVSEIPHCVKMKSCISFEDKLTFLMGSNVCLVSAVEGGIRLDVFPPTHILEPSIDQPRVTTTSNITYTTNLNIKYTDVASVYFIVNHIVFTLKNGSVKVYDYPQNVEKVLNMPPHVLQVYLCRGTGVLQFVHWDEKNNQICFTDDNLLRINCEKKPLCLNFHSSSKMVAFVLENVNSIHFSKLGSESVYVMDSVEHGLDSIDELVLLGADKLLAYNNANKLVAYIVEVDGGKEMKWVLEKVARIDNNDDGFIYDIGKTLNAKLSSLAPSKLPNQLQRTLTERELNLGIFLATIPLHFCQSNVCCGMGPIFLTECCRADFNYIAAFANKRIFVDYPCDHRK